MATRKHPGLTTPGTVRNTDNCDPTEFPRPLRDVLEDILEEGRVAYAAGRVVDPGRIEQLAEELDWCVAVAAMFGGTTTATAKFAAACRETGELARLIRRAAAA